MGFRSVAVLLAVKGCPVRLLGFGPGPSPGALWVKCSAPCICAASAVTS